MNCPEYQALSLQEKTVAIGELIHLFQNDTDCFYDLHYILLKARELGLLKEVTILPESPNEADERGPFG